MLVFNKLFMISCLENYYFGYFFFYKSNLLILLKASTNKKEEKSKFAIGGSAKLQDNAKQKKNERNLLV